MPGRYGGVICGEGNCWESAVKTEELDSPLRGRILYSELGKCCNVWQFWIICSVVLYSVEIPLSITERK